MEKLRVGCIADQGERSALVESDCPGFWEVYRREPSTGFAIRRLGDKPDGGDLLFAGAIATSPFYLLNFARLKKTSGAFTHKFLEQLGRTRCLPPVQSQQPCAEPKSTPTVGVQMCYVVRATSDVLKAASDPSSPWIFRQA